MKILTRRNKKMRHVLGCKFIVLKSAAFETMIYCRCCSFSFLFNLGIMKSVYMYVGRM